MSQLSPFAPLHPVHPHSLRQSPHHCSCPWVMHTGSLATPFFLYCTLHPHGYSVATCLYFLIPSPLHPFPHMPPPLWSFFFFLRFIFRERRKEGKKHQCVVASLSPPTGDLACNPGTCPAWELTSDPLVHRSALNPLSHTRAIHLF